MKQTQFINEPALFMNRQKAWTPWSRSPTWRSGPSVRILQGEQRIGRGELCMERVRRVVASMRIRGTHLFRSLSVSSIRMTLSCSATVNSPPGMFRASSFAWSKAFRKSFVLRTMSDMQLQPAETHTA
jgi:hypothetical protein